MNFPTRIPSSPGLRPGNWFWLLAAPAAAIACLLVWRNVFAVFAVYHLGFCLFLPAAVVFLDRRFSLADHFDFLGLTGPGTVRGLGLGLGLGVTLIAGVILVLRGPGAPLLADQNISEVLEAWGVSRANVSSLFWFMVLVNGPAEEIYWRGFVHARLSDRTPRWETILLIAACYASYHGVTVYLLVPNLYVAVLFMTAILAAGLIWGWLREKTGSVWPALLCHAGAVIGYMVVAKPMLGM